MADMLSQIADQLLTTLPLYVILLHKFSWTCPKASSFLVQISLIFHFLGGDHQTTAQGLCGKWNYFLFVRLVTVENSTLPAWSTKHHHHLYLQEQLHQQQIHPNYDELILLVEEIKDFNWMCRKRVKESLPRAKDLIGQKSIIAIVTLIQIQCRV